MEETDAKKTKAFSKVLEFLKSYYRLILLVFLVILVSTTVFITIKYVVPSHRASNSIPEQIKEQVTFPLYAPSTLPSGYEIDNKSFSANSHAVLYTIKKDGHNKVFVSIQPKPNNFNFDNFHYKQMVGSKDVKSPVGKIVIGVFGEKTIASLVTEKSWVLVNGDSSVSARDLETISKSLIQVSP